MSLPVVGKELLRYSQPLMSSYVPKYASLQLTLPDQKNILLTMKSALTASPKVPKNERRVMVHKWLEAVTTVETYQKAQLARQHETCNWILCRQEFQDWLATDTAISESTMLWIHGGPGLGKTVLCAKIIESLVAKGLLLVYFFCVADEEAKRQPHAILRSWIDQLTQVNDDALDLVYDAYKANEIRSPTPMELWKLFNMIGMSCLHTCPSNVLDFACNPI